MQSPQRSPIALPVILVFALHAANVYAQEHAIKLDRLPRAGSVIEVVSTVEQSGELGPVLKSRRAGVTGQFKMTAEIALRVTIDEVDAEGRTTKATYNIVRYLIATPRGKTPSYTTGKTFEVSVSNGKRMYLGAIDGGKWVLEEPNAGMLDAAVPLLFFKGEPGLDATLGTATPQKSGATWTADPQVLAGAFAHLGATKERAAGKGALKRARGKFLNVETGLELSGLKYELPGGYTLAEDKFQMQITSVLSPDGPEALPAEQMIVQYTALSGTEGGKKSVEWLRQTGHARYKLAK